MASKLAKCYPPVRSYRSRRSGPNYYLPSPRRACFIPAANHTPLAAAIYSPLSFKAPISIVSVKCTRRCAVRIRITLIWSTIIWLKMARTCIGLWPVRSSMTTSRNNTIMSWMAYTDFLSRLRIAAGILLPLNTRTLLLYPGGRDCIGAAGVDTYLTTISKTLFGKVSDSILIWNDLK